MIRIALVVGIGGPALEYALPRLAGRGEVHALVLSDPPLFAREQLGLFCSTVAEHPVSGRTTHEELVGVIERFATACAADVLLTFSEHAVCVVAEACDRLGLRGAGAGVKRSRDKLQMRECWRLAGVPVPRFVSVERREDLAKADAILAKPFLLKPALSSGSLGQQIVGSSAELTRAWERCCGLLDAAASVADAEYGDPATHRLIAEEIIRSSTDSWYDTPGYGDYLSVEGIVADGRYHPICVTARMPTIPPFAELSNQAPCVLSAERQRAIEATARAAVDALGLLTCGTHTEIKLMAGGGLCLIESAARLPGAMVVREVEEVFGIDMIGLLVDALAGDTSELPLAMLTSTDRHSAASLALVATDAQGTPWRTLPLFEPDRIDWSRLVGPHTQVDVVGGATMAAGTRMPRYDSAAGALNYAGLLFVIAPDPATLLHDTYAILDGLEAELAGAGRELLPAAGGRQ